MTGNRVAVCGMPRSGNRLVARMLERHGYIAEVRHFGMRKAFRPGGDPTKAILPLRLLEPHLASMVRDLELLPRPEGPFLEPMALELVRADPVRFMERVHFDHFYATLRLMAELGVAVLPVSYERIVADPDRQGRRILEFLEPARPRRWQGWGEELRDGNAKHELRLELGRKADLGS